MGGGLSPHSIGDVKTSWNDDDGKSYELILNGALYFSDSPINIISATSLTAQFDDDNGTWIITSHYQSEFTWDHGNFSKFLVHPASRLPTLQVNTGYSTFTSFCTFLDNAGLVPITQDAVFLCGSALSSVDDEDPTLPNRLPSSIPLD